MIGIHGNEVVLEKNEWKVHKLSVLDLLCCAEVAGGGFRGYHVTFPPKKRELDTKTARLRDASLCVAGSQAARQPERLGGQGGYPRWMPRWLYQTLKGVGGWEKTRRERRMRVEARLCWERNVMQIV